MIGNLNIWTFGKHDSSSIYYRHLAWNSPLIALGPEVLLVVTFCLRRRIDVWTFLKVKGKQQLKREEDKHAYKKEEYLYYAEILDNVRVSRKYKKVHLLKRFMIYCQNYTGKKILWTWSILFMGQPVASKCTPGYWHLTLNLWLRLAGACQLMEAGGSRLQPVSVSGLPVPQSWLWLLLLLCVRVTLHTADWEESQQQVQNKVGLHKSKIDGSGNLAMAMIEESVRLRFKIQVAKVTFELLFLKH